MFQVVEQTRDEKIAMYMKITKRELAEMLVNCNDVLAARAPQVSIRDNIPPTVTVTNWDPNNIPSLAT